MKEFENFVNIAKTGSEFNFSENQRVLLDRTQLIFFIPLQNQIKYWELYESQSVHCGSCKLSIKKVELDQVIKNNNQEVEYISGDNLKFPLKIRYWQRGDFFYPLGSKGKQKLSDFFINQKIGILDKKETPLLISDNKIAWIVGYRISDLFKVKQETKTVYKIEIKTL